MKRIILFIASALLAMSVCADGVTITSLSDFENGVDTTYVQYVGMVPWISADIEVSTDTIVNNPAKTGINETEKCWMVTETGGNWWSNFWNVRIADIAISSENTYHEIGLTLPIDEAGAIAITEANRFLHIMHYRSDLSEGFSLSINTSKNHGNDATGFRWDRDNKEAGVWEDQVFDLKMLIDNDVSFGGFSVIVNRSWGGVDNPAASYAFDEMVLSSSAIPRGAKLIEGDGIILTSSDTSVTNQFVFQSGQYEGSTIEFVDNPHTDDPINSGGMVTKLTRPDSTTWWKGLNINLDGIYLLEPGVLQYLHVLIKADSTMGIQLSVKDELLEEHTADFVYEYEVLSEYGMGFYDYVLDLGAYQGIQEITIRPWVLQNDSGQYINSLPENITYIDEIIINGNPDAREEQISAIKKIAIEDAPTLAVFKQQITVTGQGLQLAEVYNIAGQKMSTSSLEQNTVVEVPTMGVYIVKITTTEGLFVSKIAVQ